MSQVNSGKVCGPVRKKAFASLATVNSDGRRKDACMGRLRRQGTSLSIRRVAGARTRTSAGTRQLPLSIMDPDNPYRYLEVRGRVADYREGADSISHRWPKIHGVDKYPYHRPGDVRVI